MAYCPTDDVLDQMMPPSEFRQGVTEGMVKKLTNVPNYIKNKIIERNYEVDGHLMDDIIKGVNPARDKAMRQPRNWERIQEKAMNPALRDGFVNAMGQRRKQEVLNSETAHAAMVGAIERFKFIENNRDDLLNALRNADDETAYTLVKQLNEGLALYNQVMGNQSEAGRLLGYGRRLNEIKKEAGLVKLFGLGDCV